MCTDKKKVGFMLRLIKRRGYVVVYVVVAVVIARIKDSKIIEIIVEWLELTLKLFHED